MSNIALGIFCDLFLICASLIWLLDWTPIDYVGGVNSTSSFNQAVAAVKHSNILLPLRPGDHFQTENTADRVIENEAYVSSILALVKENWSESELFDWTRVAGVRAQILNAPVAGQDTTIRRTLCFIQYPEDALVTQLRITPVASLEEVRTWVQEKHQRNVQLFVGLLLLIGFALQLTLRLKSS